MVGLIWFVQVVHYPLMAEVSEETYQRYQERHMNLTSLVVGPPMLVEAGTALGLVLVLQTGTDAVLAWIAFGCLGVVWLSTACFQVPAHHILMKGFDVSAHRRLVRTNWLRTVGWSARGVLAMLLAT